MRSRIYLLHSMHVFLGFLCSHNPPPKHIGHKDFCLLCSQITPIGPHSWHWPFLELLLEPIVAAGALDAQGASDQSALMWASTSGLAGMVEKLLELGAKPDLKDAGGKTALDLAKSAGHTACVAVLEQHAM